MRKVSKTQRERVEQIRAAAYPLSEFPAERRAQILEAIADPRPPEKWIAIGAVGSPKPLAWISSRAWYEWHWARGIDPDTVRTPIPKWIRDQVLARDGYICQLCDGPVSPEDVHLDHIRPWSKGGEHTLDNLQVTHSRCNLIKGARYESELVT